MTRKRFFIMLLSLFGVGCSQFSTKPPPIKEDISDKLFMFVKQGRATFNELTNTLEFIDIKRGDVWWMQKLDGAVESGTVKSAPYKYKGSLVVDI